MADDAGLEQADSVDGTEEPPDDVDSGGRDGDDDGPGPKLLSRVLVTWLELTAVGLAGGMVGTAVGGLPGFLVFLATSLASVGVLLYNVNALVERRLRAAGG